MSANEQYIPPIGVLTPADMQKNEQVSRDRIIAENYFGLKKQSRTITSNRITWHESRSDLITTLCCSPINIDTCLLSLTSEGWDAYINYRKRLYSSGCYAMVIKYQKAVGPDSLLSFVLINAIQMQTKLTLAHLKRHLNKKCEQI